MRINFIAPLTQSGGGLVVANYSRLLSARGHRVVLVLVPPPRRYSFHTHLSRMIGIGHRWTSTSVEGIEQRRLDCDRHVVDADVPDADVVIATWWETSEWVAALAASKGRKVYFIQGHEVYSWLPQVRSRASYRLPLHKIVVSKWLDEIMRREYGDCSADLVPNGVDHSIFYSAARGKQARPTVGMLYNPTPIKGVHVALSALESVHAGIPNLRVLMFGHVAPAYSLPSFVEFFRDPPLDALRSLFSSCDVWLTASSSEGFNLPAMEAMACRTPVVSTRTGWPADAVINGVNGACVAIDDVEALARETEHILTLSEERWRRMSGNALDTVRECSWGHSADLLEQALTRVASS